MGDVGMSYFFLTCLSPCKEVKTGIPKAYALGGTPLLLEPLGNNYGTLGTCP